jgi:dihydrofolate synthase/folylpolyglutamate synthase
MPMNQHAAAYKKTLEYLYQQLPMFHRVGAPAFKKDLTNTLALCSHLGNPHQRFPNIHVAGTNGKGSTSHMLAGILQAHGYRVGLYTSPHYRDFRERIKINGQVIHRRLVTAFVEQHRPVFDEIQPSFFEWTVALAFDYFAKAKVDIAVVEVGLGGRLDSTNVITPLVSVITNISYDHMQFLGDTLELIAAEKAGIIKPGVPVVIGEEQDATRAVFEQVAFAKKAPIQFASRDLEVTLTSELPDHQVLDVHFRKKLIFKDLKLALLGAFQRNNLATVLATLKTLEQKFLDFHLDESKLRSALAHLPELTRIIGRWQRIGSNPTIICDSGHNEGGLRIAMAQLQQHQFRHLHMVIGMVADKDISKMLALLPKGGRYYFAKADIPRGLAAEKLQAEAQKFGLLGRTYSTVRGALRAAKRNATSDDLIYVGGSTFVVAEALPAR